MCLSAVGLDGFCLFVVFVVVFRFVSFIFFWVAFAVVVVDDDDDDDDDVFKIWSNRN